MAKKKKSVVKKKAIGLIKTKKRATRVKAPVVESPIQAELETSLSPKETI